MAAPHDNHQEPLKYQTWILRVRIDCEGCKKKVKKILQKIDGVYETTIDSQQNKVVVIGNVEAETLLKKLSKSKKPAQLWHDMLEKKELVQEESSKDRKKKKAKASKRGDQKIEQNHSEKSENPAETPKEGENVSMLNDDKPISDLEKERGDDQAVQSNGNNGSKKSAGQDNEFGNHKNPAGAGAGAEATPEPAPTSTPETVTGPPKSVAPPSEPQESVAAASPEPPASVAVPPEPPVSVTAPPPEAPAPAPASVTAPAPAPASVTAPVPASVTAPVPASVTASAMTAEVETMAMPPHMDPGLPPHMDPGLPPTERANLSPPSNLGRPLNQQGHPYFGPGPLNQPRYLYPPNHTHFHQPGVSYSMAQPSSSASYYHAPVPPSYDFYPAYHPQHPMMHIPPPSPPPPSHLIYDNNEDSYHHDHNDDASQCRLM